MTKKTTLHLSSNKSKRDKKDKQDKAAGEVAEEAAKQEPSKTKWTPVCMFAAHLSVLIN